MIHDRLVVEIRDTALSERLQMNPDLTLEKAKKKVGSEGTTAVTKRGHYPTRHLQC